MSTPLLEKSKESIESAWFLIGEGKNASSIHCSYYSCIQIIRHILLHVHKKTEATIKVESKAFSGGSHEYLIDCVVKDLNKRGYNTSRLYTNLYLLKRMRTEADYLDINITPVNSNRAFRVADMSRNELITQYKIR